MSPMRVSDDYDKSPDNEATNSRFIEAAARLCHEVIRTYNKGHGDDSLAVWDLTEEKMRDSVRSGIRYALRHPDASPREMHEEWMKFKTAQGWAYGFIKDLANKTHPNMCPYEELSDREKLKDLLFLTVIDTLRRTWPDNIYLDYLDTLELHKEYVAK